MHLQSSMYETVCTSAACMHLPCSCSRSSLPHADHAMHATWSFHGLGWVHACDHTPHACTHRAQTRTPCLIRNLACSIQQSVVPYSCTDHTPAHAHAYMQLVASPADLAIRQAAAVHFKNIVKARWVSNLNRHMRACRRLHEERKAGPLFNLVLGTSLHGSRMSLHAHTSTCVPTPAYT